MLGLAKGQLQLLCLVASLALISFCLGTGSCMDEESERKSPAHVHRSFSCSYDPSVIIALSSPGLLERKGWAKVTLNSISTAQVASRGHTASRWHCQTWSSTSAWLQATSHSIGFHTIIVSVLNKFLQGHVPHKMFNSNKPESRSALHCHLYWKSRHVKSLFPQIPFNKSVL